MHKIILPVLVFIATVFILVSFFAPWAKVKVSAMGVSKELTGIAREKLGDSPVAGKVIAKLQSVTDAISGFGDIDVKTAVRGCDIPTLVNKKASKVAISIAEVLFKSAENLDKKSYLVYLLPLLALVSMALAFLGVKQKIYVLGMLIISGAVAGAGLYNLMTMKISSLAVEITIESGLWNTMYAFLFIFLAGIAWLILDKNA